MKKLLFAMCLMTGIIAFSQTAYDKVMTEKIASIEKH